MFGEGYFIAFFCVTSLGVGATATYQGDGPLILTPYIKYGETEKAQVLSAVDPSLFAGVRSHAGYFTVDEFRKWNLFFWYFPAHGVDLSITPLVVWLNGGPGHSSLFGLFEEIGPIQVINDTAYRRPITWSSSYSLLFIDSPVGTGFSFAEGVEHATNDDEVGESLFSLIEQFLQVFRELRQAPLFLAGESYAGKYIPAFAHYIHHYQKESMPINLKGLAIGNGWIDPPTLLHKSEWGLQMGLLDHYQAQIIHNVEDQARWFWDNGDYDSYRETAAKSSDIFKSFAPVNDYNFLLEKTKKEDLEGSFLNFLNRADVQKSLHVKQMEYDAVNYTVFDQFEPVMWNTAKHWLEELLEHYGVMCYSGQLDVIVAYALSVNTYQSLKWSGAQAYRDANRIQIYDTEEIEILNSFVKASGNFMDVLVRGAGHSVPAYKPRAAKQIIDLFINKFK